MAKLTNPALMMFTHYNLTMGQTEFGDRQTDRRTHIVTDTTDYTTHGSATAGVGNKRYLGNGAR